jgi:hypothetical protein
MPRHRMVVTGHGRSAPPARVEIDESALRDINVKAGAGYSTKLYAS